VSLFRLLADGVVVLHLGFVLFVVLGGLLVVRRPHVAWVHLPAAAWGAWIEIAGWVCPLTPLENWLRRRGGAAGYSTGFVEQYVVPVLYPAALTREMQWTLGAVVLAVNAVVYAIVLRRHSPARGPSCSRD
jgi:hypothetical protein